MRHFCAMIACAIVLSATNVLAAPPANTVPAPPNAPDQAYFTLHVKDCSLPVCEEQVVYLSADDKLLFLGPLRERGPYVVPNQLSQGWQDARPGSFAKAVQLVRTLSRVLPPAGTCDRTERERLNASGTLVNGEMPLSFQFSDACARQASGSMPYQLIRELRETMTLGIQPLLKG